MTLAAVADPHIWNHKRHGGALVRGVNRRGELCLDVLQRASALAQRRDAELIVAGDLVDSAGPIQPQLAQRIRATLPEESGLVVGNHDATAADDHSLGLYAPSERIADKVRQLVAGGWLDRPLATLVPYTANIDDIRTAAPLVIGHFGIYDDSFPPYLRKRPARHVEELFTWMHERNTNVFCSGDWHRRQVWFDDGTRMGPVLEQGGQKWSVNLTDPLLDLAWVEERRLWVFRHRPEPRSPKIWSEEPGLCPVVGEHKRTISYVEGNIYWLDKPYKRRCRICQKAEDNATRPFVPESRLFETRSFRASDSQGELASQREPFSKERAKDTLPQRPSLRRGQHLLAGQAIQTTMPDMPESRHGNPTRQKIIMQIGALIATGWDNPGLYGYGTVAFWNGERLSWEELPGPRFCTVRSDEEEKAVVAEAAKLGHNLFLRRYYTGDRPETPPGLEAYEALPVAVEQAAAQYLDRPGKLGLPFYGISGTPAFVAPQAALDELVSHWLDTIAPGDERAAVQEILKRYL